MAIVMLLFWASCNKKEVDFVDIKFDPEITPTMSTDTVVTFISDSGITRYKLIAQKWLVFDKAKDPYWYFPEGLYLERFDPSFNIEATIIADTAWNYTAKRLWRLKGNVHVRNMQGEEFRSDELFWDEKQQKVYSDKYIEIKRGDSELKGYGFESNQEMNEYRIFRPHDGRIPFKDNPQLNDSIPRPLTTNQENP
jgi:LPS export ABC transporter protein LptC